MENLFIRVNSVKPERLFNWVSGGIYRIRGRASQGLPILSEDSKIQACKRHIMEIELFQGCLSSDEREDHQFILGCDDLSLFCTHLFWLSVGSEDYVRVKLDRMKLCITIGDELLHPVMYENRAETITAATKNAATKTPRIDVERNATPWEDTKYDSNKIVKLITTAKPRLSDPLSHVDHPRLRRLLDPLRVLHSIESLYIDAPISDRYCEEIGTSLTRARPTIDDLLSLVYPAYEEAITTFRAGCFAQSIYKLRGALDILGDLDTSLWPDYSYHDDVLTTGPFAGRSLFMALTRAYCSLSETLARAYLKFSENVRHVRAAQYLADPLSGEHLFGTMNHDNHAEAMAFYLKAEVWEALDHLGEHNVDQHRRSDALGDVIEMLTEALKSEPENPMLQQELKRRQEEQAMALKKEKEKATAINMEELKAFERDMEELASEMKRVTESGEW